VRYTEFNFGHVEPAPMFRRVVEFKLIEQSSGFGRFKHLVECRRVVRVEVIQDDANADGVGIKFIHELLHTPGPILLGSSLGDFDVTPARQRFEEQE